MESYICLTRRAVGAVVVNPPFQYSRPPFQSVQTTWNETGANPQGHQENLLLFKRGTVSLWRDTNAAAAWKEFPLCSIVSLIWLRSTHASVLHRVLVFGGWGGVFYLWPACFCGGFLIIVAHFILSAFLRTGAGAQLYPGCNANSSSVCQWRSYKSHQSENKNNLKTVNHFANLCNFMVTACSNCWMGNLSTAVLLHFLVISFAFLVFLYN